MTQQAIAESKTTPVMPELCPKCGASLPTVADSLKHPERREDYYTALSIMANCRCCKQWITGHFLGEQRLGELLARYQEDDVRFQSIKKAPVAS